MDTKDDGDGRTRRRSAVTEKAQGAAAEAVALVRQYPVGALAAAVGLGYVVGGGLFTRTTSRVLRLAVRMGVRFALMPLIERELSGLYGASNVTLAGGDESAGDGRTHH